MPVLNNALAGAAGSGGADAYKIERSLRFNAADQAYLERTPSKSGNSTTWTFSTWYKKYNADCHVLTCGDGANRINCGFVQGTDKFFVYIRDNSVELYNVNSTQVFRDPAAWYHIVIVADTHNTTQNNRIRVYINGERIDSWTGNANIPAGANTHFNTAVNHAIGRRNYQSSDYISALMADTYVVDGQALDPVGVFGEFDNDTGVWKPKKPIISSPNDGTVWSNGITGSALSNYPATNGFNGDTSTYFYAAASQTTTFTFSPAISGTTFELFMYGGGATPVTVNGTDAGTASGSWVDVSSQAGGSLSTIACVGGSSSQAGFSAVRVDGVILVDGVGAYGQNGFHLDFKNNSSNSALGFDARVEGTRYSADWSGTLASSYTFATLFDGNVSTLCLGANGATLTWEPATPITWTDAAGGVEVYYHNTSSPDRARVNGGSWVNQANNSGGWEKVTTGNGTLTKLELADQASSEVAVYAIRVNGTILTDPAGANDWRVHNLTALKAATGGHGVTRGTSTLNYDPSPILDGDITTDYQDRPVNGNGVNFTGIPAANTQLRVRFSYIQSGTMTTNGGHVIASGNQNGAWVEPSGISYPFTLTSISVSGGSANDGFGIAAIEVDGTILTTGSGINTDSLLDSPTNYEADSGNNGGNYCTLNPLDLKTATLTNCNLEAQVDSSGDNFVRGTLAVSSGKWYWEFTTLSSNNMMLGAADVTAHGNYNNGNVFAYYANGGALYGDNTGKTSSWSGSTLAVGDVLGVALDMDNGTLQFYRNNSLIGTAWTGLTGKTLTPYIGTGGGSGNKTAFNAGQRPFIYTPPSGFKSVCTENLDTPVAKSSTAFDAKRFIGNGNTGQSIPLDFSPDFLWFKADHDNGQHALYDNLRGPTKSLVSNHYNAEATEGGGLASFDSSGFSLSGDNTVQGSCNGSGRSYMVYAWDAGNLVQSSNNLQTETWSAATGALAAECFDGSIISRGLMANEQWYKIAGSLTVTSSMRIYLRKDEQYKMRINGGTQFNANTRDTSVSNNYDWADISIPTGTHTNVEIRITGGGGYIHAIEVDGKMMCDPGAIPRGAHNPYEYNQGATWSAMFNPTPSGGNGDRTFNGKLFNQGGYLNQGGSWVPTGGIVYYDKVEIIDDIDQKYAVNGGTQAAVTIGQWVTLASTTNPSGATLTSIDFTRISDPATTHTPLGIRIDGKLLVDSGVNADIPSMSSFVRTNPTTGCSIVTYTGTGASGSTVGHGLNATPAFWVMKGRSQQAMWVARHKDVPNTEYMQWDDTAQARNAISDVTGDADATSSVIPIGSADANNNTQTYVAYCWTPIPGFSAMGKFDGNSNASGPFINCGFRPAWIMVKNITTGGYPWHIYDKARDGYNFQNVPLYVDLPDQEGTSSFADILSNGFKIRDSGQVVNNSNDDYIWMAFAEYPFKYALAR